MTVPPKGEGATASDRLSFDTGRWPQGEALDRYRAFFGFGSDVEQIGPDLQAVVEGWRLDGMILYHRRLSDVAHRREAHHARTNGFTHFIATLLLEGEYDLDLGHGWRKLEPGEVFIADTLAPAYARMRNARIVTLSIARKRLAAVAGPVEPLHGVILRADEGQLYREFVVALLRSLPTMSHEATLAAAGVLTTLLGIAIDTHGAGFARAAVTIDGERIARLRRLADARLSDPDFDAAALVREAGLSRATLYRLLSTEGGVATFLRDRRLEQVRRGLSDPANERPFSELVLAAGLPSVSHASRAFLERYGLRPTGYRNIVGATTGGDALTRCDCGRRRCAERRRSH